MATYDLRGLEQDFVVHYGGDDTQIDAFTFGNSLLALGNALQSINKEVNPSFTLEISVVALGGGSFRPQIRARAKRLGTLLIGDFRQGIVGALAALIVTRCLGTEPSKKIEIHIDRVEVHTDGDVIILPRDVYDIYERTKDADEVDRSLRQAFEVLEEDEGVRSFGFARKMSEVERLPFQFERNHFGDIARPRAALSRRQREILEKNEHLQIVRAIFEDSSRRWQFVWRGVRISAPLLDLDFRRRIVNREISITHGDVFVVDLRIIQVADETGLWINESYEIVAVSDHQKGPGQADLLSC